MCIVAIVSKKKVYSRNGWGFIIQNDHTGYQYQPNLHEGQLSTKSNQFKREVNKIFRVLNEWIPYSMAITHVKLQNCYFQNYL
jgi:hypothetical protein